MNLTFTRRRFISALSSLLAPLHLLKAQAQPGNVQGIGSGEIRPPRNSNRTANINVQMNYWPAKTCNLSECHEPLFNILKGLSKNGRKTVEVNYGAPAGLGLALQCRLLATMRARGDRNGICHSDVGQHLHERAMALCPSLEHFRFSGDGNFLRNAAYPIIKGSAEFLLDWIIEGGHGEVTTCPSFSTENGFVAPDGKHAFTSAGGTLDLALIHELLTNCEQESAILGTDNELSERLVAIHKRLPPYQIGRYGQLQERSVDFLESEPEQRHTSHLYCVYPGSQTTPRTLPK